MSKADDQQTQGTAPANAVIKPLGNIPEGSEVPNLERLGEFYLAILEWTINRDAELAKEAKA